MSQALCWSSTLDSKAQKARRRLCPTPGDAAKGSETRCENADAAEVYEALNEQLKLDLPRLYTLQSNWLELV